MVALEVREDVQDSQDREEHAQGLALDRDLADRDRLGRVVFCPDRAKVLRQDVPRAVPHRDAVEADSATRRAKKAR